MAKLLNKLFKKRSKQKPIKWLNNPAKNNSIGNKITLPDPTVINPADSGFVVPEFPSYVALEVTNVCNLKCKHCNYRHGLDHYTRDRGFMSLETAEKVLREVKKYNASALMNYDGEPLMNKDYLQFLKLATDLKVNNYFNTNGTLFDKKFSDQLVEFYKGSVFFSVDGNKEWFEKIRTPAVYDQVVDNINYFIDRVEKTSAPITIGISLCNLGQTPEERKMFLDQWLPKVNYVSMGEVNDKFGTMVSKPITTLDIKKRPPCVIPWQTMGICWNGDVIPCSIYVTRANIANAIFGNITKNSLKEIWDGVDYNNFRKMISEERYVDSFCDKCERWLCQFSFPTIEKEGVRVERNGYWTTYHNTEKGDLNFK